MFTGSFSGCIVMLLSLSMSHYPPRPLLISSSSDQNTVQNPLQWIVPLFWISSANLVAAKYFIFTPQHLTQEGPITDPGPGVLIPVWSLETRDIKHEDCKIICIQFLPLLPFLWLHWASLSPRVGPSHPMSVWHHSDNEFYTSLLLC